MRAQEFFTENKTASNQVIWDYIQKNHPREESSPFLKDLVLKWPRYELKRVPLANLEIPPAQYSDDAEEPDERVDPYGRTLWIDYDYAGETSADNVDRLPIVVDPQGHIIDGNHRAWAAAELLNRDSIQAWVAVPEISEKINTDTIQPGFEITRKMKNGYIIRARALKRFDDLPDHQGVEVSVIDPQYHERIPVADARFKAKQDPDTGEWFLSSLSTGTMEPYRRQGLASAMYNFARTLGNEIRPSRLQSRAGEDFWKKGAAGAGRPLEIKPEIDLVAEDKIAKGVAKQLQTISRPASTSDSDVKSFMSQGYTIKFHPDRFEIYHGGDLVYSRPGHYANPKRSDLATAKARIPQLIRQRLGQTKTFEEEMNEVQILAKVKGKGSEPGQIPKYGRSISPDQEVRYLGQQVGKVGRYQLWRDWLGGQLSYHVFDPESRTVVLTTFGSRYHRNPNSYIIHGLYAAPGNPVKAHQFYRNLILAQGLTLISDRKQSPGGNRVWQRLEAYPDIEVYGFDTKTGEVMNFGAADAEMYAVPPRAAQDRESRYIAKNIRLVATAR